MSAGKKKGTRGTVKSFREHEQVLWMRIKETKGLKGVYWLGFGG